MHETAARLLGLSLGDRVRLGGNSGFRGFYDPITLVVVGTFRPLSDLGWESDLLTGDGVDPDYSDERETEAAYGPFVVDDAAFLANGSPAARLRVTARPDMARADRESVIAAVEAYDGAGDRLAADLADRVTLTRVTSRLPDTLDRIEAQRAAGRSVVLVAVLLGAALSLAALLLAGRLVAAVRDEERVLLVSFGASPRQQLVAAGFEAVLLAIVAAGARPAGRGAGPLVAHPPDRAGGSRACPGADHHGRAGADRARLHPGARPGAGADRRRHEHHVRGHPAPLGDGPHRRRLDPDGCGRGGGRARPGGSCAASRPRPPTASTSRSPSHRWSAWSPAPWSWCGWCRCCCAPPPGWPFARRPWCCRCRLQQAARRPHPGTAMVLIAAAVAAATFGLGLRSTWERSQVDQADLRVGTDLSLAMPTRPTEADAAAVLAAVDGQSTAVSAVVDRPVVDRPLRRHAGRSDDPGRDRQRRGR